MSAIVQSGRFAVGGASMPYNFSVTNPGAETGDTTGWTVGAGTLLSINTTGGGWVGPHSGSRYFSFDTSAAGANAYQEFNIPSAYETTVDTGFVAFWLRGWRATDIGDFAAWTIIAYDGSNAEIARMEPPYQKTATITWTQYTNFLRLPSGTRKVRITMIGPVKSGSFLDAYFDDIECWLDTYVGTITSYANAGGSGNRTASITSTSSGITAGGGAISELVDGSQANSFWWTNAANTGAEWIKWDFGSGVTKIINQIRWYQDTRDSHGVWDIEGSNDNATWTSLHGGFTLQVGMIDLTNTTAYRYYRMRALSGNRVSASYDREIEFKIN